MTVAVDYRVLPPQDCDPPWVPRSEEVDDDEG